jgi:nitronate monooxygenase/enoyl-[acyl-carrier protein] reductase II
MGGLPAPLIREQIRLTRELTARPFGVNLLLPFLQGGEIDTCVDEGVSALVLFWGDPSPHIAAARGAGVKVVPQVGSVDEAKAAADAGADAVIVQGVEAGGHVRGTAGLSIVLPAVVDAVAPLPVVAAGGIADGRGIAAALVLGAQAVSMGTRFVCSREARLAGAYKDRVARARAEDTVHAMLFDGGWPEAAHRVLRTATTDAWEAAGRPPRGQRPGEGTIVGRYRIGEHVIEVEKYAVDPPTDTFEGDIEQTALYCGQSCSLVNDIRPAADIVRDLAREAEASLGR